MAVADVAEDLVEWPVWEVMELDCGGVALVSVAVVSVEVMEAIVEIGAVEIGVVDAMEVVGLGCPAGGPMYCWPSGLITPDGSIRAVRLLTFAGNAAIAPNHE